MGLPRGQQQRRRWWKLPQCVVVLGVLTLLAITSCSVEHDYDTLKLFFDGVPDPNQVVATTGGRGGVVNLKDSPTYSIHKPFAEEACDQCHAESYRLEKQNSSVCLKCHQDLTSQHERMHGPVAAGACVWCHEPHESALPHLMNKPVRAMCAQCHQPALLKAERVPEHAATATQSCLECHDAHGGTREFLLKPGISNAGPATQPVPQPAQKSKSGSGAPG